MKVEIIRLTAEWAAAFRDIRLESLKTFPEHYASSFAEESAWPIEAFIKRLEESYVAGVLQEGKLLGIGALARSQAAQMLHRGTIISVYVKPEMQGKGIGRDLIQHLLDQAATEVEQVHIAVGAGNKKAIALYESLGFEQYGYEPRAAKLSDGRYIDDKLLMKILTR